MYYNQCNENTCSERNCKFSCFGIILAILAFFAALGIGALIGATYATQIMAAMAAIIVFVIVIAILIAILLIYRFCSCRRAYNSCD